MLVKDRIRSQIIEALSQYTDVAKAIIFGSRARGDADERSDIDLAVIAPKANLVVWMSIIDSLESIDTLIPIDVVRYEEASAALRSNIDQEGVVIYERCKN